MAKLISTSQFRRPLDVILEEKKILSRDLLNQFLEEAGQQHLPLEEILVRAGRVPEEVVYTSLAESFGLPFHSLEGARKPDGLPAEAAGVCSQESLFPIAWDHGLLTVATFRPAQVPAHTELLAKVGCQATFVVSPPSRMMSHLGTLAVTAEDDDLFGGISDLALTLGEPQPEDGRPVPRGRPGTLDIGKGSEAPSVIELVNKTLILAVRQGASDIHVESLEDGIRVRFRLDGVMSKRFELTAATAAAFISRIMVMAGLDITEKVMPQDGSFKVTFEGRDVEFRIASMPGLNGQNLTLRLLSGHQTQAISLQKLGMREDEMRLIQHQTRFPHGMVLVSGPTGSGKSTTLYAILEVMASPALKLITIEDPVERRVGNVQQIQVRLNRNDPERSLTFARGLRTILRLDPDIIMVGEIRDRETADIAVQASLTGHLVFSTVHANSSLETLRRLQNIGVDTFLLLSSLNLVLAQRLVRKLCPACKASRTLTPAELSLFPTDHKPERIFAARSCRKCLNTGYSGRVGLFEFLPIDDEVRDRLQDKSISQEMVYLRQRIIRTLRNAGLLQVAEGNTDLAELERVAGPCL